jgi:putative aminopeptidase FrvX
MPFETVALKTVEYLAVPSVVGHEKHFFKYLKQDFEKLGLRVEQHEGILEISGAAPKSTIISAHVDRHGLISVGKGQYAYAAQYVREEKYNEENNPSKRTLEAISERFEGEIVFAYDPETGDRLGEGTIESCSPCMDNGDSIFYVNGMDHMPKNIPVGYARSTNAEGDFLKGQIDNVVSLGVIYVLFQNGFQGTALLSAEEEIGKSWIHIQNWLQKQNIETQELVIIDTSPYRETGPTDDGMVVLRNRDKSAEFNPDLALKIKNRCKDLNLPYQVKDEYFLGQGLKISDLGSTELGRLVQNSKGRFSGATVQIPTMEYHTSYETTTKGCIENFYTLLQSILITDGITNTKT